MPNWAEDVQRYADTNDARFQVTLDVEQLAAWVVIASAARAFAMQYLMDDEQQEVVAALAKANEAEPVRIA